MTTINAALEKAGFGAFADALRSSGFSEVLETGPYTIFAPQDEAFAKFSHASLDRLMLKDKPLLRAVIGYHFAAGKVLAARFAGKRIRAMTYAGQPLMIDGKARLRVNNANLVMPDILCGASVIHGIDGVLWPREQAAAAL
jgi:uncharacterized surface protein with fasciclin (FAS1) repeats